MLFNESKAKWFYTMDKRMSSGIVSFADCQWVSDEENLAKQCTTFEI